MKDWRNEEGVTYNPSAIPGILVTWYPWKKGFKSPMFICAYCGGTIKQIRGDNGEFLSRRCKNENCYTLASMTGEAEWKEKHDIPSW